MTNAMLLVSVFFVVLALILLVVLTFLYKLTMAVGRLDRRLEQLTRHLRDFNLFELQPPEMGVLSPETEMESRPGTATDAVMTPSADEREKSDTQSKVSVKAATDALPDLGNADKAEP